jgi:hypothetical protein
MNTIDTLDSALIDQSVADAENIPTVPGGASTLQSGQSRSWTTSGQPD